MKKSLLSILLVFLLTTSSTLFSQGTAIPQNGYTIQSFSTNNNINVIGRAFDTDTVTFWALGANNPFPAYVEIDLGTNYDVNGFSFLPRSNATNRPGGYEVYLSSDGINWGTPEVAGAMPWTSVTDATRKDVFFGAITARYVKVVYTSSLASNNNIHTCDLFIYESTTAATGKVNQAISLSIPNKSTADAPFTIWGTATSSLQLTYSIVSGPATISGNTVTLTGAPGIVTVKADQAGNTTYYPSSRNQSFEVIDLTQFIPTVSTRLTGNQPLQMNSLEAYPIYMNATIDQPTFLNIDSITLSIGGQTYKAEEGNGYFYYLWTPSSFGNHTVDITSHASNGNDSTITRTIVVSSSVSTQNVPTINNVDIIFGGANSRWYYGTYSLPQFVGGYDQIHANLTFGCPNIANACDDWDRLAYIDIKGPDGNWIQIIRYITPYGVACNHGIDLSDYASLLQGEFEFRVFIDTWGTGGWQVSLDFDYQAGTPTYKYSSVDEIWDARYDLGNPANIQPVDTVSYIFPPNVQDAKLIVSNTGHGWGSNNTSNAAEFYNATNYIYVNGANTFTQNLWNVCNPNPDNCTGQQGTWTYSRAGWCPGAIAPPSEWNLSSFITSGIDLHYRFDSTYTDLCHPNNPGCVSGSTCADCNDTYNPSYEVDGHVINFSNTPLLFNPNYASIVDNTIDYTFTTYPNPTQNEFRINIEDKVTDIKVLVFTVDGVGVKTYYFKSNTELNNYQFDVSNLSNGTYFISIENNRGSGFNKLIISK
ncbi:peptide-N-glycosidase F-related protein [bacterium]|nr:peptide-N-glycosidase F-related protein [bacterium]